MLMVRMPIKGWQTCEICGSKQLQYRNVLRRTSQSVWFSKNHLYMDVVTVYRWKVRVGLPPGRKDLWLEGLLTALLKAESGMRFPVRFEQNNLLEFLSLEELKQIEAKIPGVTFYVYGVEQTYAVDNSLLRKAKRAVVCGALLSGGL